MYSKYTFRRGVTLIEGASGPGGCGSRSLLRTGGHRPPLPGDVAGTASGGRAAGSGVKTWARAVGAEGGVSAESRARCRLGVAENSGLSRGAEER